MEGKETGSVQGSQGSSIHSCPLCPSILVEMDSSNRVSQGYRSFGFRFARHHGLAGCEFFSNRFRHLDPNTTLDIEETILHVVGINEKDGYFWIHCWWVDDDGTYYGRDEIDDGVTMVMTPADHVAAKHITKGRLPQVETLCQDNIQMLRDWFKTCRRDHPHCQRIRRSLTLDNFPRYLLDISTSRDGRVRLIETRDASKVIPYAALSYCWGDDRKTTRRQKTLKQNIQDRLNGFPLEDLPSTLRDAVQVCQILRLKYLWIDAVCIVQDGDDLGSEMREMVQAYSAASLVISAARASHADEGFLGRRIQDYEQYLLPICFQFPDGSTEIGQVRVTQHILHDKLEPIDIRGWTLQEHDAAVRLVRFESEELVWRCPTTSKNESDIRKCTPRFFDAQSKDGRFRYFLDLVEKYSRRETTKVNDRLNAFESCAMKIIEMMKLSSDDYQAGLLKPDLRRQLLWSCDHDHPRRLSEDPGSFPSWTWASADRPVLWNNQGAILQDLDWGDFTCEVENCTADLLDPDRPFGSVTGGCLTVRAYAPDALWTGTCLVELPKFVRRSPRLRQDGSGYQKTKTSSFSSTEGVKSRSHSRLQAGSPGAQTLPFHPIWDTPQPPPRQVVKCLEIRSGEGNIGHAYGIVLVFADKAASPEAYQPVGEGPFKRIGYFKFIHPTRDGVFPRKITCNWLHQAKKERVHII